MLFLVRLTDDPDRQPVRKEYLPAHLAWLEQQPQVLVAGSLRLDPDSAPVGGCWVVEASDRAAVEALLRQDPFWVQGLRKDVEILHWSKAFPDRKVLV